jgi:predicted esterase
MQTCTIATRTHGRYLVDPPDGEGPWPVLVGFHGYAERAEDMLDALRRIRGERAWLLVSVQALHRFYTRSQAIVGNWMTSEDRELAIADNIEYVAAVVKAVRASHPVTETVVYAGFSQGVAMAYRAAAFVGVRQGVPVRGGIMLAGDVPPDVAPHLATIPRVLIGRGTADDWYTLEKADADQRVFQAAGCQPTVHVFEGGHLWDESFVAASGRFLDELEG